MNAILRPVTADFKLKALVGIILFLGCIGCLWLSLFPDGLRPLNQQGPLVGKWRYDGADFSESDEVYALSFCDTTWWVQFVTEFRSDGIVNSSRLYPQSMREFNCVYQVKSDREFELSCGGRGPCSISLNYKVENNRLTIWFNRQSDRGPSVTRTFTRIDAIPASIPAQAHRGN